MKIYQGSPRGLALACSYNITGTEKECDAKAMAQAANESRKGHNHVNHNLYRTSNRPQDVKFTIPIQGIPILLYPLLDAHYAGFEQVLVIGNSEVGKVTEAFKDYFSAGEVQFIHEGELGEISRSNTIKLQLKKFAGNISGPTIEVSGDTPIVDTQALKQDVDHQSYHLTLHVNVKQVAKEFFPRNYRWRFTEVDDDGVRRPYDAKEPNAWIWDLPFLYSHGNFSALSDGLYDSRKSFGSKVSMFAQLIHFMAFEGMLPSAGKLNRIWGMTTKEEKKELIKTIGNQIIGKSHSLTVRSELATELAANVLGDGVLARLKAARQPGLLVDMDSLEDIINMEQLLAREPRVYKHHENLHGFGRHMDYKWGVELTDNWTEIANAKIKQYGIDAEYGSDKKLVKGLLAPTQIQGQASVLMEQYQFA